MLPCEESWKDACELCERDVEFHEGPDAARKYQFVVRGIAEALVAVGAGSTYRDAAGVARERARRLRADPETGELRFTRHGSLVMDWVEVFAPVVFEAHRPRDWPANGSLVLDDLPFRVRDPQSGRHRIAFRVFCAMGYDAGRPRMWRLEAFASKSQADWEAFLGALGGAPPRVVCDNDSGLTKAVRARFPQAELYLCEWHLRHALERLMGSIRAHDGDPAAIDELLPRVAAAFTGPSFWAPFLERAHAAGRVHQPDPRLDPAARVRAEEPRAHQPDADAHAAARQRAGRRSRLHAAHPRVARGQPRPPGRPAAGHHRPP